MAKKNKLKDPRYKNKKEAEDLEKIRKEIGLVKPHISQLFKSAETIAVDPEFKEVSFYADQIEFDSMKKNITTDEISLTYLKCDKDMLSLYFRYSFIKS